MYSVIHVTFLQMSLRLFMGFNTADANERYFVAIACDWYFVFSVLYDP